jgi:mRNA interferase MazF
MKNKVVLVRFPFDDLSGSKMRPAICLTSPIGPHEHILLAFVTSKLSSEQYDVCLLRTHPDFQQTGLKVDSTIKANRLITIAKKMVLREIGEITTSIATEVQNRVRDLLQN